MPLGLSNTGKDLLIQRVGGREDTRKFLATLGLLPGAQIKILSELSGNLILKVKESRVAISREMAMKIFV